MEAHPQTPGRVYLVGAGPGDPGLITIRGVECLGRADLVLYDYLVNPALLEYVRPTAKRVCLGHHRTQRSVPQEEIHSRMIEAARAGQTVVRLKGGDPDIFGQSAQETAALRAAGIPYETIPGVTAALAAAGYAGIPITLSSHASAVALVTGQERHDKASPQLDYAALAAFPGTLIFYMGVTSARRWSEALVRHGKPAETPVMIVRRCTWPDQTTVRCTLGTVSDAISAQQIRPPAVIVVGEVVGLAPEVSWFMRRPLFGTRILVTRPKDQVPDLAKPLSELGAEVLVQPVIQIEAPSCWDAVDEALDRLATYDWLAFSSSNGVRYFLDRLLSTRGDLRRLGNVRLAAIGPGTADELARYHLKADLVPEEYRAEALAEALANEASGQRFLLVRASRGREVLAETLLAAGGIVDQVVVYNNTDVVEQDPRIAEAMAAGKIDWVTVTSSTIARSLIRLFGESLKQTRLASISPVTSATLREQGYEPEAEAKEYTMEGVVEAILAARMGSGEQNL